MTIGIAKVNGMGDPVVLKVKLNSTLIQLALRPNEIFAVSAQREMEHPRFVTRSVAPLIISRRK